MPRVTYEQREEKPQVGGERGLQPGEHLFKARISIEGRG